MKKIKTALIFLLTFMIVAASFVFPSLLFRAQDSGLESQIEETEINEVSLSLVSDISMVQKLLLVNYYDSSVNLDTGRFMDSEKATETAIKEIHSFVDVLGSADSGYNGLYIDFPLESSLLHCYPMLNSKTTSDTNFSAIIWYLAFQYDSDEESCTLSVALDDESGKVLHFYLYLNDETGTSEYDGMESDASYDTKADYVSPEEYTDNIDFEYFYNTYYTLADFITGYLDVSTYSIEATPEEHYGWITVYDDTDGAYTEENSYTITVFLTSDSVRINL